MQEVSGVYTSPFLHTDERKMALRARKVFAAFEKGAPGFQIEMSFICIFPTVLRVEKTCVVLKILDQCTDYVNRSSNRLPLMNRFNQSIKAISIYHTSEECFSRALIG